MKGSAYDLAVTRVVFFAYAFSQSLTRVPAQMAELPRALVEWPTGARWLFELVPPGQTAARLGALVMAVAALAALFGIRARLAATVWCALGVWVLGIPNLYGKVDHNHHLLWFAALLAASPCADVLAFDARRRGRPIGLDLRYGVPIRVWWGLIGVVYLFAGLPKLLHDGLSWASPANLRPLLHVQWAAAGDFEPLLRIDRNPSLLWLIGMGTLVFEIGFIWVVFTRYRAVAVVSGLVFHLSTYALLDISFTSLVLGYVAFAPWGRWIGGIPDDPPPQMGAGERHGLESVTSVVGTMLLAGAVLFGAANVVDGWPFASYPSFTGQFSSVRSELEFAVVLDDGSIRDVGMDQVFSWVPQSRRGRIAVQFLNLEEDAQRDVLRDLDLGLPGGHVARSVHVTRVLLSTDPDAPGVVGRSGVLDLRLQDPGP